MSLRVIVLVLAMGIFSSLSAQVLTPMEISDERMQRLQQRHLGTLMDIGSEIQAHTFPYPFYFSRVLDVDLPRMQQSDQRSIRFDIYKGQTVLEITGNYYAAYSADRMDSYARLKETFERVIMPLLQSEVTHFPDESDFSAFAIEVSHHVRQEVSGVSSERPENITVIIPVPVARKLTSAKSGEEKQAAILDAQVFLNGEPHILWMAESNPPDEFKRASVEGVRQKDLRETSGVTQKPSTGHDSVAPMAVNPTNTPPTSESLLVLQYQYQDTIDRMLKALDPEAHFLSYVPPTFTGFRQAAYLQLSFRTSLEAAPGSSRYKLAALSFDEHVSHLIRPLLEYFPSSADFEGISFSSMIQLSEGSHAHAVEFFFPFKAMRCFVSYDCTGQQLLNSGIILINGESSTLNLQVAEGGD